MRFYENKSITKHFLSSFCFISMGRKKVILAFIINDAARRASYQKRKKSLLKKVEELSTLCDVEAAAIVYSRYHPEPEVWPSPMGVQNVLSKFTMLPMLEQSKKMLNQEAFLEQSILKAKKQVDKQIKENKENAMTMYMFQCLAASKIVDGNMPMVELNELSRLTNQNLKDIDRRMETLSLNAQVIAPSQAPAVAPAPPHVPAPAQEMTLNGDMALMPPTIGFDENGNGDEAIPFGGVNLQMGYFPNL